jgi:hypothetical protein
VAGTTGAVQPKPISRGRTILVSLIGFATSRRARRPGAAVYAVATLACCCAPLAAAAQSTEPDAGPLGGVGAGVKAYVTAPLHARRAQWVKFGAVLGGVVAAYQYDEDVRESLLEDPSPAPADFDTRDGRDAVPAALVVGATWLAAAALDDDDGRREVRDMLGAAALSSAAAYVLKQAAGRERPYVAADAHAWRARDDSFPSLHATAAFAIGTVLAESGNGRHRWLRRTLGYGIAVGTAYARLDHDAHWLSDAVAGAGLGVATARFVMKRRDQAENRRAFGIAPAEEGIRFTYTVALR